MKDEKHPTWTRKRFGRDRVHWVAYDDRAGAEGRIIVAQGYAASLPEADAAARSALAEAGMYRSRRTATGFGASNRGKPAEARRPERPPGQGQPRQYLYTRHQGDDGTFLFAHLILKKTPRKVYVTERSCGLDQLGTDDEAWEPNDRAIALDRARLERDGSAYSGRFRHSDFYLTREGAAGDSAGPEDEDDAFGVLGLRPPCTVEDIKAAYRRRALEVHPDRGGSPGDFQAVEAAYRRLLGAAGAPAT